MRERLYPYSDSQRLAACELADLNGLVLYILPLLQRRYCTSLMKIHGVDAVPERADTMMSTLLGMGICGKCQVF